MKIRPQDIEFSIEVLEMEQEQNKSGYKEDIKFKDEYAKRVLDLSKGIRLLKSLDKLIKPNENITELLKNLENTARENGKINPINDTAEIHLTHILEIKHYIQSLIDN